MTPAVLNDDTALRRGVEHFERWSREATIQGKICGKVGLPLGRALIDLGPGEDARGTKTLSEIRDSIYLIGGSHAQRHLFDQLIDYYSNRETT